jgi:apolipoprotein N-acyltransferase
LTYKRILLYLAGLLAYVLSFPPVNLWFLAFFALVPLLYSLVDRTGWGAFWRAFLFAAIFHLARLYWILSLEVDVNTKRWLWVGFIVMVVYLSVYYGLFGLIAARALRWRKRSLPILFIPSLWVLLEVLRGSFYTGFPWSTLWLTQLGNLPFAQIASVTGPYGLSWLVMASNAWLFWVLRSGKRVLPGALLWLAALFVLHVMGALRLGTAPEGEAVRVAILQPDFEAEIPGEESWDSIASTYDSLSGELEENVDLIVLSESALPGLYRRSKRALEIIDRMWMRHRTPILLGSVSYSGGTFYNVAFLVDSGGAVVREYRKSHLVPFGEWLPYEDRVPFLRGLYFGQGDYRPGPGGIPLEYEGMRFGVLICFESIFPYVSRAYARNDASFLVNVTSDGLFGRSLGPFEHFELARFRAIENGRYIVRCAKRGISGIIDPRGRVETSLGLFRKGILTGEIRTSRESTFYMKHGDIIVILSLLIAILSLVYNRLRFPGGER